MKNKNQFLFVTLIVILFLLTGQAMAQKWPGTRDSIYSDVLKEKRVIQIILPKDYKADSNVKYEVLYILDGEWYWEQVPFIYNFAASAGYVPQNIFVLIPNTYVNNVNLRDRDFSPTRIDDVPHLGGADNFHSFLKNELIPYVEKKYPSNGQRSLLGSSFSGLFAVYAFVKEPALFQSYIASDPNLNWDNNYVSKLAAEKLPGYSGIKSTLFIAGLESTFQIMGSKSMDSVLTAKAPPGLPWKCIAYADETHYSVQHKAFYDGMRFSHLGYSTRPLEYHPMNGILEKDKPLKVVIMNGNSAVRFTTDGTEPTASSPIMNQRDFMISAPAQIKTKSFSNRKEYDHPVAPGTFTVGMLLPSTKLKKPATGGLNYSFYEGEWNGLPDFKKLRPAKAGIVGKDFRINDLVGQANSAYVIEGSFEILEDGYYIFVTNSTDGLKLHVGDKLVMSCDGVNSSGMQSFVVSLKKGFYPLRAELLRKKGSPDLLFFVLRTKPGNDNWGETEFFSLNH